MAFPLFFFGLFQNLPAFLTLFIMLGGLIGIISRKLSIAAFGSLLIFIHVVMNTDIFIFDAILYLSLTVIILTLAFIVVNTIMAEEQTEV